MLENILSYLQIVGLLAIIGLFVQTRIMLKRDVESLRIVLAACEQLCSYIRINMEYFYSHEVQKTLSPDNGKYEKKRPAGRKEINDD